MLQGRFGATVGILNGKASGSLEPSLTMSKRQALFSTHMTWNSLVSGMDV